MLDCFLAAASGPDVGMGHVMRSLSVARQLKGLGASLLGEVGDERAQELFRAHGIEARLAGQAMPACKSAWLDGFRDWSGEMRELRSKGTRIALVENRLPCRELAHWIIQPSLHHVPDDWERDHADRVFGGRAWVPLTPEVIAAEPANVRDVDLLITFGGADPGHLTERLLDALIELECPLRVCIVMGWHMGARSESIGARLGRLKTGQLIPSGGGLAPWIARSKFAVTALGTTLYEFAYLGLPALILANYDKDQPALDYYAEFGPHRPLGVASAMSASDLKRKLRGELSRLEETQTERVLELAQGSTQLARLLMGMQLQPE